MSAGASLPIVQIALDVTTAAEAVELGWVAHRAGADWLELGKPLIEFIGLSGAKHVVADLPETPIIVDLMIMAAAPRYVQAVAELGAAAVTVTALAPEVVIEEAVRHGNEAGVEIIVDLFNVDEPVEAARSAEAMGADQVMVHVGVDQRRVHGTALLDSLSAVVESVDIPVGYATYDLEEGRAARAHGASVLVQGGPIIDDEHRDDALGAYIRGVKDGGAS